MLKSTVAAACWSKLIGWTNVPSTGALEIVDSLPSTQWPARVHKPDQSVSFCPDARSNARFLMPAWGTLWAVRDDDDSGDLQGLRVLQATAIPTVAGGSLPYALHLFYSCRLEEHAKGPTYNPHQKHLVCAQMPLVPCHLQAPLLVAPTADPPQPAC